jgi:hypothetical protein
MDCVSRLKSEAAGEFSIGRGAPGLGLIYECLAETFFQHANPRLSFSLRVGWRVEDLAERECYGLSILCAR